MQLKATKYPTDLQIGLMRTETLPLAINDHPRRSVLRCIQKGKLSQLYVGLYGAPNSEANKFIIRRANQLSNGRRAHIALGVSYFDAATAKVWSE